MTEPHEPRRASDPVTIVVIGAGGGYGSHYLRAILRASDPDAMRVTGVVDPRGVAPDVAETLASLGVPRLESPEAFFGGGHRADLAVIASPIHLHVPHSMVALAHGSHVLCDKPLGATVQEADELIAARDAADRFVRIGYQWSHADGIQSLKQDLIAGRYGAPRRARTLCLWPRDAAYYRRNDWAGRLRDRASGRWVLDSPLNNAHAHFAHNLLYLLGPAMDRSAAPAVVQAEAGRRLDVESFDTVTCRIEIDDGAEILFIGSHATESERAPVFEIELERAIVRFDAGSVGADIVAERHDGTTTRYPSPDAEHQFRKLFDAVGAVRTPSTPPCGPEAARAQTVCVNGVHESVEEAGAVPPAAADDLVACYESWRLPSEAGSAWSVPGRRVDVRGYRRFPSRSAEAAS